MRPRPSNLNAYKHGLTAQTLVLTAEEKPAYDQHCQSYFDLYKPIGHPEKILVQNLADDYWRSLRGRALENAVMSKIFEHAPSIDIEIEPSQEKTLGNLALYIQRIERSIKNNTKALLEMQQLRKEAQSKAEQEATLLARAAFAKGESYDPAADFPLDQGFVFSKSQLVGLIAREDRLTEARALQAARVEPQSRPEALAYKVRQAA